MNAFVFAGIFSVLYGILVAFLGNQIIDFLFLRKRYDLTFQDDMYIRGKNRKIFLFLISSIPAFFMSQHLDPLPLAFALVFTSCMAIVTITDLEQYLIFDFVLLPYAVLGIIATLSMGLPLENHLLAGGALFVVMLIFAVISRGGIGGGDIKLLAVIGLWLGEDLALLTFASGAFFGGIYAFIMLASKKKEKGSYIAYGPFFSISALVILALAGF